MGKIKTLFKRISSPKYNYDALRYAGNFVSNQPNLKEFNAIQEIPRVVYCCWTGNNEMSPDRARALDALIKTISIEVVVITPYNLPNYILPEYPLHKGYDYLSLIQKSDYLRCYLMHHYGGGYTDIKLFNRSWGPAFDLLDSSPDKWVVGYREIGKRGAALVEGNMGTDLKKHWHLLLGNCSFICRPRTPFTSEWYSELHRRMDFFYDDLVKNPGDAFGKNAGYPIPWAYIMGHIFHPLCLKYNNKMLYSSRLKFVPSSYR